MMKRLAIWLILGTLTGCAVEPVTLPDWQLPPAAENATQPIPLPALPALHSHDGGAVLDRDGLIALMAFKEAAEANTAIARENALALDRQAQAYNALILAGQHTNEIAAIRAEMLERERNEHQTNLWFYRGLIALGAVATIMR